MLRKRRSIWEMERLQFILFVVKKRRKKSILFWIKQKLSNQNKCRNKVTAWNLFLSEKQVVGPRPGGRRFLRPMYLERVYCIVKNITIGEMLAVDSIDSSSKRMFSLILAVVVVADKRAVFPLFVIIVIVNSHSDAISTDDRRMIREARDTIRIKTLHLAVFKIFIDIKY